MALPPRRLLTTRAFLSVFASLFLLACGGSESAGNGTGGSGAVDGAGGSGGDNGAPVVSCSDDTDEDLEAFFQSQTFSDGFDCGRAGNRWIAPWEAVVAGSLDPAANPPEVIDSGDSASAKQKSGSGTVVNYVLQSPDPMLEDGFSSSTEFSADFEEQGTLAFNYFVQTSPGISGIPRTGNYFEVSANRFAPDADGFPELAENRVLFRTDGRESSRYFEVLPAGDYIFAFCHTIHRTEDAELPDFIQIDDVETCVGLSCRGAIPEVPRCRVDQGQTLVPSLSAVPTKIFDLNRVQGTDDRYYMVIDLDFLDFIVGGLETLEGERWDAIRAEVDALGTQTLVDGQTCDVDTRRSLLFEMSDEEFLEFLLETGILEDALEELEQAFIEGALEGTTAALVNAAADKIEQEIGEAFAKFMGKVVGKLIARLL